MAQVAEPFGAFALRLVDIIPDRQGARGGAFLFQPDGDVGAVIFGDGKARDGDVDVQRLGGGGDCGGAEGGAAAEDEFVAALHWLLSPELMKEKEN